MKYSCNHTDEFDKPGLVFILGFMQFSMAFIVELTNMFLICGSNSVIEVITNFIVMQVVAEFDDIMYAALPVSYVSKIDKSLPIKYTSSRTIKDGDQVCFAISQKPIDD